MIEEYKFGIFKIDGKEYAYDIKIADKVRHWPDRDGYDLKIEHVQELIDKKPEILIIGTGANGMLNVPENIKNMLYIHKIKFFIEKNPKAVELFNQYSKEKKRICAIFPATC